jgi:hypothetical protein
VRRLVTTVIPWVRKTLVAARITRFSGLAFRRQQSDVSVCLRRRRQSMSRLFSGRELAKLVGQIARLQSLDVEQLKTR